MIKITPYQKRWAVCNSCQARDARVLYTTQVGHTMYLVLCRECLDEAAEQIKAIKA